MKSPFSSSSSQSVLHTSAELVY
jgi:hypothetical protein